jgi:signal transduction histidine kinase
MLLWNILNNAMRYNKDWWNINIFLDSKSIIIEDSWIWMDQNELNKIFDRFYQVGGKLNQEWFGIWLSIVKKILDLYWFKFKLESEVWKGTKFIIILK